MQKYKYFESSEDGKKVKELGLRQLIEIFGMEHYDTVVEILKFRKKTSPNNKMKAGDMLYWAEEKY